MARRLLVTVLVPATGMLLGACGGAPTHRASVSWRPVTDSALAPAPSQPVVETVTDVPGEGWMLGGVVIAPDGSRQVAIWSAGRPAGPWAPDQMAAVPGRDGPNETVFGIVGGGGGRVAFGYRRSPTEGYPRPSTWIAAAGNSPTWHEILEPREFFGGPDIIGFGTLTSGPHGYTIAGTWTDPEGRPTVAVWRSADGSTWTRDSTAAAFDDRSGLVSLPSGEADSDRGILVAGTVETPTRADPGRQAGALWYSRDGRSWSRVALSARTEPAGTSSTFDAVTAIPGGWLVAGTEGTGTGVRPVVWFVDPQVRVGPPGRLPGAPAGLKPRAMTYVDGSVVLVAARGGTTSAWRAAAGTAGPGGWTELGAPRPVDFPIQSASISAGPTGALLVVTGSDASSAWWTSDLRS